MDKYIILDAEGTYYGAGDTYAEAVHTATDFLEARGGDIFVYIAKVEAKATLHMSIEWEDHD